MYLKIQQQLLYLGCISNRPEIRREENKVEFLEGGFLDEKLPFFHKKKAEITLTFSFHFFVF